MKGFKFSVLILILSLFLVGLAACSGSEGSVSETDKDPAEEQGGDEAAAPEEEEEEETYDLGGRVIKIANHWDLTPQGGTEYGDLSIEAVTKVEEKYNVKIEYVVVPFEEKVSQLTTTIISGEPFADLVGLDSTQAAQLIKEDYLVPLDSIADLNEIQMPKALQDMYTIDGKVYMFGHQLNQSGGMYYNKTMFDQAGLPDPYELQQKGEWTWDAMLDAAKKLTNGTSYGLSADPNLLSEYLVTTNNGQILNPETFEIEIDSPNALEAYEFLAALYNEHKVVKANEGNNWEDPRRYFTEGSVGMTQGWVWEAEGRVDVPFEMGYVMWPKGPKADDYVVPVSQVEGMTIPVGVENPEVVYKIWEDLQIWSMSESSVIEWFEMFLPSAEAVDTATTMLEKINSNFWQAYNIQYAFSHMTEQIALGAESPAQAVAKVKDEAQALVNDFLGK